MKNIAEKHIVKRLVCWILLLQMIHVSINSVNPLSVIDKGFAFREAAHDHQVDSLLEWLTGAFFNHTDIQKDVPVNDRSEEESFLEEFSIGLLWPALTPEFIHVGTDLQKSAGFGHYLDNFVPHYIEPHSPPPNQAS